MPSTKKAAKAAPKKTEKKTVAKKAPAGKKAVAKAASGKPELVESVKLMFKRGKEMYSVSKLPGQAPTFWLCVPREGLGRRVGERVTDPDDLKAFNAMWERVEAALKSV